MNETRKKIRDFPRSFDILASALGLLVLLPLMTVIALLVRLTSPGPAFFRARRVGRDGCEFALYKFRSMRRDAAVGGSAITSRSDARITRLGRFLRKSKLDELPQLYNVLKGDMSLVGPRPEDPRFVPRYPPELRSILRLKPGITSAASIAFRDESTLLGAEDHEARYIETILPHKLRIDMAYFSRAGFFDHLGLILRTVFRLSPHRYTSS